MTILEAKAELEALVAHRDEKFKDCKDFLRYAYGLVGIILPENLYDTETENYGETTRRDFTLVEPPYRLYDIAVFRNYDVEVKRHVGVMLDSRWMAHHIKIGNLAMVARAEITRDQFRHSLIHVARHKNFL